MLTQASEFQTPLHGWPTWVKFVLTIASMTLIVMLNNFAAQILITALIAGLYAAFGRAFFLAGIAALRPLLFFIVFILIWNLFRGTIEAGALVSLRLINAIAIANLFTLTTRLDALMAFLNRLLAPLARLGINTAAISLSIALAMRFIPVLLAKSRMLMLAWRARSTKRAGHQIIVPMTLLALDDASQIAEALRARGGIPRVGSNTRKIDDQRT